MNVAQSERNFAIAQTLVWDFIKKRIVENVEYLRSYPGRSDLSGVSHMGGGLSQNIAIGWIFSGQAGDITIFCNN